MADAPAGGGAGTANGQAAIAQHAAVTQQGAQGDAATIARVEDAIKNSPMGWLQSMLGEVDSRAASERGQVQGKVAEQQSLVAQHQKDAPKEAGPAPAPGHAAHPAVPAPAAAAHSGPAPAPQPASGGAPAQHLPVVTSPAPKSSAPAAPAAPPAPAPTIAAAVASAGSDAQLDGILNAYTPKSQQTVQTLGRIKQMGDIAQGFNGQLEVYVAQGGAVERGIAATANFLGSGKEASAVWATNPYRKVHGVLGGIVTGLSAVKNVCGVVGNICSKLGLVLTVIGLLGMIFPPIGVAVSGIARVLNVVGVICEAVSFALSGILTGLNGVTLAQQIAAGASAEEKAATADLMMSEANAAASGFTNIAMIFGPKFMSGMLGSSKGVISSLMRRARSSIGRISIQAGGDLKLFANKIVRKLGFGGAAMERVGGAWKDNSFVARAQAAFNESRACKVFNGAPAHLEAAQEKLMARYGNTAFARGLDRVGAWGGATARHFDFEEKVGGLGTKAGKAVGNIGAETGFGQRMARTAEESEAQTRKLAMQVEARDASHLEETRWKNYLKQRATDNPDEIRDRAVDKKFIAKQGARVRAEQTEEFEADEAKRGLDAKKEEMRTARSERRSDEYYENETNGLTGKTARDSQLDSLHATRARRYELQAQYEAQLDERKQLLAKTTRTADENARLSALDTELKPVDEARRIDELYETDAAGIASGGEARRPEYKNWGDIASNAWGASSPAFEFLGVEDRESGWESAEKSTLTKQVKYDKGTAASNAASRGGHGTFGDIATSAQQTQMADFAAFVRAAPRPQSISANVRGMLSKIASRPAAPAASAPVAHAPVPAASPSPTPTPGPSATAAAPPAHGETVAVTPQVRLEPVTNAPPAAGPAPAEPQAQTPASVAMAAMDEAAGDALPYWPAMMPDFEHAQSDFGWMRKVAVEFKKAQIEGKQKAVDTLAVYGRYQEYAKLRAAAAQQHGAATQAVVKSTQQNVDQAGQSESHAGQGEAKQGEAKGAANDRAAVDLPEPESRGFWGTILGATKRWAKDKAAQVFGWIQEKIASVVLKGLCGVSMGDLRDYAGALKRQQTAAHGVAAGAGQTAGQAQQTAIKLGANATKEAQSAADAIGECDRNLGDADNFMADVTAFEQQLAEEKAHAQAFLSQLHAEVAAQQAAQKQKAAAELAQDQRATAAGAGATAGGPAAVAMAAMTSTAAPATEAAPADDDAGEIRAASAYVASQSASLAGQLDARAEDYQNQLAIALTNHTGKSQAGVDLKAPATKASKEIVEEFETLATHTTHDMDGFASGAVDPSQAHRIADAIIQSADHLEGAFAESEHALDELFERTYAGIRDGQRTLKSRLLDGDNVVGNANRAGDAVSGKAVDAALPAMTTAWNTVSAPIQVASAAPVQRKADGAATTEAPGAVAVAGLGAGGPLPHLGQIQASFGRHDVTPIRAHAGGSVDAAAGQLGARAYATGTDVAFAGGTPDLHTAAHEAAHVVQQRDGVHLKGGLDGGKSDPYEQHADAVADAVVAGKSAEPVLDRMAGGGPAERRGEASVEAFSFRSPHSLHAMRELLVAGSGMTWTGGDSDRRDESLVNTPTAGQPKLNVFAEGDRYVIAISGVAKHSGASQRAVSMVRDRILPLLGASDIAPHS